MTAAANDVTALTFDQLATGLRAWARGLYPLEATVDVLLAHRAATWNPLSRARSGAP